MENIFLEQYIVNMDNVKLKINHQRLKDVKKFVNQINENPGYLFLLNKYDEKVYIGEIIEISYNTGGPVSNYEIEIGSEKFSLKLFEKMQKFNFDILERIYSQNQKKNIGIKNFSLKNTYGKKNFKFARPIIYNYDFLLWNESVHNLRNSILEEKTLFNNNNNNKIYAKFLEEDGERLFSLTNFKMIETDLKMLETLREDYRPYFYEFYIEEDKSQLHKFQIGEIYEVVIADKYYKVKEEEINIYEGSLLFSASPLIEIPATLIIKSKLSHDEKEKINESEKILRQKLETKRVKDGKLIERSIMNKIPTTEELDFEITIYNVGQGNWSKITVSDSKGNKLDIVYDVGMGNSRNLSLTKKIAQKAAAAIEEHHIFILSHWDLDHIKGVVYLTEIQFNTTWIVPELPSNISFSALRLALYLFRHPNINVIFVSEELNNKAIFSNKYIALGKGEGKKIGTKAIRNNIEYKTSYTINNNIGLVLCVKNKEEKILFTGDCEYIQLPIEFLNTKYDAIVMAHHGASIKYDDLTEIGMLPASKNESKAYVCVGKNNKYPHCKHVAAIKNLNFKVVETRSYINENKQIKIILD
ncbi:MAG TPA: MBL fold metallo-hydrolase [Cerasibacillus sp.]|uniref:MBL fold metallo-hydrolase n=1 Tax=Cerasibacillus sp. TaxID=2498711 RepID=UPI002F41487B